MIILFLYLWLIVAIIGISITAFFLFKKFSKERKVNKKVKQEYRNDESPFYDFVSLHLDKLPNIHISTVIKVFTFATFGYIAFSTIRSVNSVISEQNITSNSSNTMLNMIVFPSWLWMPFAFAIVIIPIWFVWRNTRYL
jgi:hypothetical protein